MYILAIGIILNRKIIYIIHLTVFFVVLFFFHFVVGAMQCEGEEARLQAAVPEHEASALEKPSASKPFDHKIAFWIN